MIFMGKIIVTGGAGFIGSHIVDALIKEGHDVHVVDNLSMGKKENVNSKAVLHVVDIRDREKLISIFKGAEYVFHEAALTQVQYSIENPIETNEINVGGLLNVLEASRLNNVKRIVFASSCAVYGDQNELPFVESMSVLPLSPYGVQKYVGEIYFRTWAKVYAIETVSLRYFNVYGPRQSTEGVYALVIAKFLNLHKKGMPLTITGDGKQTRDYVNVFDVVNANILAMKSKNVGKGEVINIGTGEEHSVNQIAELIGGPVSFIPPRIEPRSARADTEKAKELLGWKPEVEFENGIEMLKNC